MSDGYTREENGGCIATGYSGIYFFFRTKKTAEEYIRLSYIEKPIDWKAATTIAEKLEEPLFHEGDIVDAVVNNNPYFTSKITKVFRGYAWSYTLLGETRRAFFESALQKSPKQIPTNLRETRGWYSEKETEVVLSHLGNRKGRLDEFVSHNIFFATMRLLLNNDTLWSAFVSESVSTYLNAKLQKLSSEKFFAYEIHYDIQSGNSVEDFLNENMNLGNAQLIYHHDKSISIHKDGKYFDLQRTECVSIKAAAVGTIEELAAILK